MLAVFSRAFDCLARGFRDRDPVEGADEDGIRSAYCRCAERPAPVARAWNERVQQCLREELDMLHQEVV
eukprot:402977-Pyramimonas_sp.AAC.1